MRVREIMTGGPAICTPGTSVREVACLMVERDCGAIPVVESLTHAVPVGILTDRDIVCRAVAAGRNPLDLTAGDVMSAPVATVTPEASVGECVRLMGGRRVRRVPVVDGRGELCGIVAQADVVRKATGHQAAELVHEVSARAHAPAG
jgi:CBS domain-containing protein